jgi:hypothetical protein
MFDAIKSVSGGCAEKLRTVMSMSDSSIKLLRFVSANVWGSADRQFVFRHIAEYLVQAWDVRNTCKHSGDGSAPFSFRSGGARGRWH